MTDIFTTPTEWVAAGLAVLMTMRLVLWVCLPDDAWLNQFLDGPDFGDTENDDG